MSPAQVSDLLSLLSSTYPAITVRPEMVASWSLLLHGDDADQIRAAAIRHIRAGNRFFPSLAELIRPVAIANAGVMEPEAALARVMEDRVKAKIAIDGVGSYRLDPWPPEIERAIKAMGGWDAVVESDHLPSLRAHFLRVYEQGHASAIERESLADLPAPMRLHPRPRTPVLPAPVQAERDPRNVVAERTLAGIVDHIARNMEEDQANTPRIKDLPPFREDGDDEEDTET